jgi:DNA mismatch repair protein MutL
MVDMHAAHERVNYNLIRKARFDRKVSVQRLLTPVSVTLTEEQTVQLLEEQELLSELGLDLEQEQSNQVRITGVPQVVAHLDCVALVREIATEQLGAGMRGRLEERIDHLAARLACHASIRSGHTMSREQVYALFSQLDNSELAAACPHGRPVVAEFRRDQVERWFGRDR